jgi:hypothetical protein
MSDKTLNELIRINQENQKLPSLSKEEQKIFEVENIRNSVFYSNILEGNTLTKEEAFKAMMTESNHD